MLPTIANYFGVSLDDLVGMEDIRGRQRQEQYHAQWNALNDAGENEAGVALMREALRQFPGESLLAVQLACSLEKCGGPEEARAANRAEAIALSERLARDDDPEIRNAFLFNLCHSYWKNGETAKAIERAQKLPNIYKTKENALVMFLQGEEKLRQGREGILHLTGSLFHQGLAMAGACAPQEAISLLEACCGAARALYPSDDVPDLLRLEATAYFHMTEAALQMEQPDAAMEHLRRCVDCAARCREASAGPRSLLAEGLDASPVSAASFQKIGLERLTADKLFRPLRDHPEFQAVMAALEPQK